MNLVPEMRRQAALEAQGIQRLLMGTCFACGKDDRAVEQIPRTMAVSYFCCDECRLRHKESDLRFEAERLLLLLRRPEWKRRMTPMLCPDHDREALLCRFCKKNQLEQSPFTHEVPIMCGECWQRVRRLAGGERATA